MADKIGAITLDIIVDNPTVTYRGRQLSFSGHFSTKAELLQLQELFCKAEGNVSIHQLIGGNKIAYDCTEDSILTVYCEFDNDRLQDGFYVLVSLNVAFQNYPSYYPFAVTLFYLGSPAIWQDAYSIYKLEELTNDWSI